MEVSQEQKETRSKVHAVAAHQHPWQEIPRCLGCPRGWTEHQRAAEMNHRSWHTQEWLCPAEGSIAQTPQAVLQVFTFTHLGMPTSVTAPLR